MTRGLFTLTLGAALAGGCHGGESITAPSGCVSSRVVPDLHRDPAVLTRTLAESDRRLCLALRDAPGQPVRVVVSFARLLRPEEVTAFVERESLQVFMIDARFGWSRGQRPVGSLAESLDRDRASFDRWLRSQADFVERTRASREAGLGGTSDEEFTRLDEEVRKARDTGPLYAAVGVAAPATALPQLARRAEVRYLAAADLMVHPKGIDPETGEWE